MSYKRLQLAVLLVLAVHWSERASGQTPPFSSDSTGADGALNYPTPGIYYFNPKSFTPALDPEGDNIFHFTTINIAAGVTLKFSSAHLSGPVYWLAQGDVTINGTLDLDGEPGAASTNYASERVPSAGGPGGYGGGSGGGGTIAPQAGNGPGGGAAATTRFGGHGVFTGNQYLVPLIGGSGGGGALNGSYCGLTFGGGGGGGGGAILIASSTAIKLSTNGNAYIYSRGGGGGNCDGGAGSGGSIRLVANTVTGSMGAQATSAAGPASYGRIRVEAVSNTASVYTNNTPYSSSTPFALALPTTPPSALLVTSIAGVAINANPFFFPDASINSSGPVTVNVQGRYIPVGTVPKIYISSETGPDQTVNCSPLSGTLQVSTCSASITFPSGGSRGFVKATWTSAP